MLFYNDLTKKKFKRKYFNIKYYSKKFETNIRTNN